MHGPMRSRHPSSKSARNTLMSKANAENWYASRKVADHCCRYSRLIWGAGTGRYDHRAGIEINELANADSVVSDHFRCFTELVEIAGYVEDEGIVVIDDGNQNAPAGSE